MRNESVLVKPHNYLLTSNKRTWKIEWTRLAIETFLDIKESIRIQDYSYFVSFKWFRSNNSMYWCLWLRCWWLFISDSTERHFIFLRKAFVGTQLKWITIQKRSFAIYYCCKNLYYLLSDCKFSILTDHKIFFISRILLIL